MRNLLEKPPSSTERARQREIYGYTWSPLSLRNNIVYGRLLFVEHITGLWIYELSSGTQETHSKSSRVEIRKPTELINSTQLYEFYAGSELENYFINHFGI